MTEPSDALKSNLEQATHFLRQRVARLLAISITLLIPIFWHHRIEAGDLASHTYNAWLANLIERGQAPGLYIAPQWTNIAVDIALARLGQLFGFVAAERIVVSACVLIFFWGGFALIASAARRTPWFLIPALAMVTYGWTLQMGFLNYYLSLGLGFFALAFVWRARSYDWVVASALLALSVIAHPMGLVCTSGIAIYVFLSDRLAGGYRWSLLAAGLITVLLIHFSIMHHYPTRNSQSVTFYLMNGSDQFVLYGHRYIKIAMAAVVFAAIAFLYDRRRGSARTPWRYRAPLEIWAILLLAAALIPDWIRLPQYAAPVTFLSERLTSITAIFGLCVLGHMRPRVWHLAGSSVLAAVFFAWLYQDSGVLNRMEVQIESLVAQLPPGRRVVKTIWPPGDSRIYFINHMVDRACIGHCFSYSNYEPSSQQFRIRARSGNPIVTDSAEMAAAMDLGRYRVRPEDLPMSEIYQCDANNLTRLCVRDLAAGEENGRVVNPVP